MKQPETWAVALWHFRNSGYKSPSYKEFHFPFIRKE